jgi:hypothetical protein
MFASRPIVWCCVTRFTNVVHNAITYGPAGSTIFIRVEADAVEAALSVADEGPGIPAEHRERIFDRFYRIDEGRSRASGGAGLGLAIARWAVEANGGRISLASSGTGSVFRITLPRSCVLPQTRTQMEPEMKTTCDSDRARCCPAGAAETVDFDKAEAGKPPSGWTATQTGSGQAKWEVTPDATAPSKPNVLKQSAQATYPICLKDDTNLKDGFVEVKFKAISGKEDQAAGLVWRAKDANNYYVAPRERARKQRDDLSHDRRSADGAEARADDGGCESVAHVACRFPGQSLHGHVQRPEGARLGRRDVQGWGKTGPVDEGGQRDGIR